MLTPRQVLVAFPLIDAGGDNYIQPVKPVKVATSRSEAPSLMRFTLSKAVQNIDRNIATVQQYKKLLSLLVSSRSQIKD